MQIVDVHNFTNVWPIMALIVSQQVWVSRLEYGHCGHVMEMLHNVIQDALEHAEYFSLEISHDSMQESSHAYKCDIGLSINFSKHSSTRHTGMMLIIK